MKYNYLILSPVNDYYLSDALCRKLESEGNKVYFNLRDSKDPVSPKASDVCDCEKCILILNSESLDNSRFIAIISTLSKSVICNCTIYLLQNETDIEMPKKWGEYNLIDGCKGLTNDIIGILNGLIQPKSIKTLVEESSVCQHEQMPENTEITSEEDSDTWVVQKMSRPNIISLLLPIEGASLTIQRALRYISGDGVPLDSERAFTLFKRASEENPDDALAHYYLGACCETMNGLSDSTNNYEKACSYYDKAIALGFEPAVLRRAMSGIFVNSENNDYSSEKELFTTILKNGNLTGAYGLGILAERTGNMEDAIEYYSEAAELGLAEAQNALGCMYAQGLGVKADDTKALQWFELAAQQGLADAEANLGARLITSEDDEQGERGEELLRSAMSKGNQKAAELIAEFERLQTEFLRQQEEELERQQRREALKENVKSFFNALDLGGLAEYAKDKFRNIE